MSFFNRTQKEKRIHYTQVANGTKPVKKGSKFTKKEQIAYARGQRDARNESARITKYKNSTPAERAAYKQKKAAERAAWKAEQKAKKAAEQAAKKAAANNNKAGDNQ